MNQSTAVIIATTGRPTLKRAVQSVIDQTHPDITAVVVVDGDQFGLATLAAIGDIIPHPRVQILPLPQNTGAGGYMGHRIYGAVPLLVNQDWLFFLDDDNWFDPEHVAECVGSCVEHGLSWCATMRRIFDAEGNFVCVDECESLAVCPVWFNENMVHVDTSCFCVSRSLAVQLAQHWHRPQRIERSEHVDTNADVLIANVLIQDAPRYALVAKPTVNYTLGSREHTPSAQFFLNGNNATRQRNGGKLPWE